MLWSAAPTASSLISVHCTASAPVLVLHARHHRAHPHRAAVAEARVPRQQLQASHRCKTSAPPVQLLWMATLMVLQSPLRRQLKASQRQRPQLVVCVTNKHWFASSSRGCIALPCSLSVYLLPSLVTGKSTTSKAIEKMGSVVQLATSVFGSEPIPDEVMTIRITSKKRMSDRVRDTTQPRAARTTAHQRCSRFTGQVEHAEASDQAYARSLLRPCAPQG